MEPPRSGVRAMNEVAQRLRIRANELAGFVGRRLDQQYLRQAADEIDRLDALIGEAVAYVETKATGDPEWFPDTLLAKLKGASS